MTRFDLNMDGSMEPSEHGRWVRYEDAQRTWVGLTDEERDEICLGDEGIARAIEALNRMAENARELGLDYETHKVDQPYDWSEWVCPDPKGYLMKCCDCGLVHEAEFGVVRYKSEAEREDCEPVDDPNLQAVFRMRRSEQWSPVDTAHRAGGLTMEQPAQRQWVGLTDDAEILTISNTMPYANRFEFARAIEAKLKEKNT